MTDAELNSSRNVAVRHLAFFRAASAEREGSNEYRTLLAGLLVLRLLDKRRVQASELLPVRHAVDALDDGPVRRILSDLVDAIRAFADAAVDTRMAKLIAYAQLLEHDARYEVSADVFLCAIELPNADRELLPLCYQRAGICLRKIGDLERAAELIRTGLDIAHRDGDQFWWFKLRLSTAMLDFHRGDLPAAERQLETIIADADAARSVEAAAQARHERGLVAYNRNQDGVAIEYYYAAMKRYLDPELKLRAMHDLALALADLGHMQHARTVLSAVRNMARLNVEMRHFATLNLMRLAVLSGEQLRFDQLRRELADERMPGHQRAAYHMYVGQGYLKFGESAKARQEFAEALVLAQAHRVYKVLIEAEELLNATPEERAPTWKDLSPRPGLLAILDEIRSRVGEFAEATE